MTDTTAKTTTREALTAVANHVGLALYAIETTPEGAAIIGPAFLRLESPDGRHLLTVPDTPEGCGQGLDWIKRALHARAARRAEERRANG